MTKRIESFSRKRLPANTHASPARGMSRRVALLGGLAAAGLALRPPAAAAFTYEVRESPFPTVKARDGVLSWRELERLARRGPASGLGLDPDVAAIQDTAVTVEGFMLPYDENPAQSSFLIAAYFAHCIFCMPGSMLSLMEIAAARPVAARPGTVMLRGRLQLLDGSEDGLLFRLKDATSLA
jgi:hypothetical protein